jgi:glycerophosphoryl diester phosphodiesterase
MKAGLFFILTLFCWSSHEVSAQQFDIQGHRGCRGLMPENSIPGFLKAIDLGVTTIEMDVVISADGKVVVSHDPYISSQFCQDELGMDIKKDEEREINIYRLLYDDVRLFDCGKKENKDFPEQTKISSYKPLLTEVIESCEKHITSNNLKPVQYNIEIKSTPSGDGIYNPAPDMFTELVYNVVNERLAPERICIQSFDIRVLQVWKMKYKGIKLSFLVANNKTVSKNLEELGFIPEIYSPYFKLVDAKDLTELHSKSVKVIPWTINDVSEMKKLIDMGVDGLITDYPDRYFANFPSKP